MQAEDLHNTGEFFERENSLFYQMGGRLPSLQAVRNKYVSVAGVNLPSDKRSARMRRDSEKCYVG